MRMLVLADRSFASREHTMLRRLEIGLIDEGVRVIRATPTGSMPEPTAGLSGSFEYLDSKWRLLALSPGRAMARMIEGMESLENTGEPRVDVIHVWGVGAWKAAGELAGALGADLMIEVPSREALGEIVRFESAWKSIDDAASTAVWLAPDSAMAGAVARLGCRWPVRESSWGVHTPAEAGPRVESAGVRSITIMSTGREPASVMSLLTALSRARSEGDPPLLFLDSNAAEHHPAVWKHAAKIGLLPRLSLVPDLESRRELVLGTDVLVQPECLGEHHTLVLDAMVNRMAVVQRADRLVAISGDASISVIVPEPSEQGWAAALERLLSDPAECRKLGDAARGFVSRERPAHRQVKAVLEAASAVRGDQPFSMPRI